MSQERIEQLQAEKAKLNPTDPNDAFAIKRIDNELDELIRQQEAEQKKEQAIAEKDAQLQELILERDYNGILGHPKANAVIHAVLKEETQPLIEELTELRNKLGNLTEAKMKAEEEAKENLERATKAESELAKLETEHLELLEESGKYEGLKEENAKQAARIKELEEMFRLEQATSRQYLNENARLNGEVRKLEDKVDFYEKQKQQFAPSQPLSDLLKEAQEYTNQKKQLRNIEQIDKNTYKGVDAEGREVTFPWYAKNAYEEVDNFPLPPVGGQSNEPAGPVQETGAAETVETFLEDDVLGVQSDDGQETSGGERADVTDVGDEPKKWHQWADEMIKDLSKRVERLEDRANIQNEKMAS